MSIALKKIIFHENQGMGDFIAKIEVPFFTGTPDFILLLDNTNNTFNINNSYDVSTAFKYIDNKNIMTGESNDSPLNITALSNSNYIKSIFRIINPFLKVNIFKNFVTDIKNVVVFPNEMDININYVTSKINPDDESKYVMLKKSDTDTLYDNIIKYTKEDYY